MSGRAGDGVAIGTVGITRLEAGPFGAETIAFLEALAAQAVRALAASAR